MSPLPATPSKTPPRYIGIGQGVARMIDDQAFRPGQRLPSVRELAAQHGVSVSTAVQALRWLEERHRIIARPRAGYFVAPKSRTLPSVSRPPRHSVPVVRPHRTATISGNPDLASGPGVNFGGYSPKDARLYDGERVRIALARATRLQRRSLITYDDSPGTPLLREAMARRALALGCTLDPARILVTQCCTQAVSLCLQAVTRPGDTVALESPTHFGFLDLLEALHLRALEIPTHPRHGISLPALQLALDTQPVKAVLLVPALSNPLGASMRLADKRRLVQMLSAHQTPLIEDVIFNDLLVGDERRRAAKSFDTEGLVMVCGSFSKTLAPGLRLGWVEPGRWHAPVASLKRVLGGPTNVILEHTLADVLSQGGYEARVRQMSERMRARLAHARACVVNSFPAGTRVSDPPAGYALWAELPSGVDTLALHTRCQGEGIGFGPGALFSASDRFGHCLRLSFAGEMGGAEFAALERIGELAQEMLAGRHARSEPLRPACSDAPAPQNHPA
ncbi:PLP-dependent aminotransferase family protein [Amphibiibacter pelophylacis]|uniref:PLP-dependent aminotransferase family protein n=1 Tax=Amphibiibacter pelophylacis TaxID=1799477 RepID=A0ACC6P3K3_9BURK